MPNAIPTQGPIGPCAAAVGLVLALGLTVGCQPTVKVEAPDKPIEINLNIKIQQEVLIKVEKEAEALIQDKSELF